MKLLYYLLISIMFAGKTVTYVSDKHEPGKIFYNPKVALKWSDFKQAKLTDASANTSTAISYKYEDVDGVINIEVYCVFYKAESFYKKGKQTDYLLNHEQRHFDITYIFAMELVKRIKGSNVNSEQDLKRTYDQVVKEWDNFQEQYDDQTENSTNEAAQTNWNRKIDDLIKY